MNGRYAVLICLLRASAMQASPFKQIALRIKPEAIARVVQAQLKRPSSWLGVAGTACWVSTWQLKRAEAAQLRTVDKTTPGTGRYRKVEATLARMRKERITRKNQALGILFIAGVARYGGY